MKNNRKRPKTTTSIKTSGVDGTTLVICFVIWIVTLIAISSS